jgi:hypothetical protein
MNHDDDDDSWALDSGLRLGALTPARVHRHDRLHAMMREAHRHAIREGHGPAMMPDRRRRRTGKVIRSSGEIGPGMASDRRRRRTGKVIMAWCRIVGVGGQVRSSWHGVGSSASEDR